MLMKEPNSKSEVPVTWDEVFETETELLGHKTKENKLDTDPNLTGLCLSGGGVRSAIFCGGVVEYLARKKLLHKFDYLSTVSGGGYTGAALSYWGYTDDTQMPSTMLGGIAQTAARAFTTGGSHAAEKAGAIPKAQADPFAHHGEFIRHLRANISYLMPGGFRDALVGAYVVLRSILVNMLIWIGLASGLFYALLSIRPSAGAGDETYSGANETDASTKDASLDEEGAVSKSSAETATATNGSVDTNAAMQPSEDSEGATTGGWEKAVEFLDLFDGSYFFLGFSLAGLASLLVLVILFPVYSLGTFVKFESGYLWRKFIERMAGFFLIAAFLCLPIGLLPVVTGHIEEIYKLLFELENGDPRPLNFGALGATIGSAISIFGLYRARLGGIFGTFSSITVVLGAILLIVSVAVLAMHIALSWSAGSVAAVTVASFFLAVICNINDVSLGRFYRDRLMEAFMPNKDEIKASGKDHNPLAKSGGGVALQADRLRLTELKQNFDPSYRKTPAIHLINTNILSWWAPDTRAQRRRGDNFILSPLFCGSDMTHWKRTEYVAKDRLTLATATAVSGAAVNPQGGFAGQGPTTSSPVAIAMTFLSLRLGYWLRWTKRPNISKFGNRIHPGFTQLAKRLISSEVMGTTPKSNLGKPWRETPGYIELSDGGHFDNLGLYEMIRRECRVMLVCDGGHDPEYSYDAFSVLIRRVSEDFGAKIKFDVTFNDKWTRRDGIVSKDGTKTTTGPHDLVAREVKDEYPSGAEYADKGYFLASVTYEGSPQNDGQDGYRACRNSAKRTSAPRKGLIIYLKSTLIREVSLRTKGYRGSNPLFPSDPTSNQFFSPEQFEAYRDVGQKIAAQMDRELVLENLLEELTKQEDNDLSRIAASLHGLQQFA